MIGSLAVNILLIVCCLVILVPIVFMLTASFMSPAEIFSMPYRWIPKQFNATNYFNAIAGNDRSFIFVRNVINSLVVALSNNSFGYRKCLCWVRFGKVSVQGKNDSIHDDHGKDDDSL